MMKLKWKLGIAIPLSLLAAGIVCWFTVANSRSWAREAYFALRPARRICKQRAAAFQARRGQIEAEAKNSLKPGTKKADVVRFFVSENMPLTLSQRADQNQDATGEIHIPGLAECEDIACGDDATEIWVEVELDGNGTVISAPRVDGMYTDCL